MSLYFMSFPVAAFLMFATVAATEPPRDVNGVEVRERKRERVSFPSFSRKEKKDFETKKEKRKNKALTLFSLSLSSFLPNNPSPHQLPSPLTVPNVFYALALLRLPVLYLGIFFVTAVEKVAELAASLKRLDAFLALPEPPPPAHLRGATEGDDEADVGEDMAVAFRGADFDWGGGKCGGKKGEELDTSRFSFESSIAGSEAGGAATATTPSVSGPTLKSITLHVKRGELLGIAGPVGSGKSSLLLALLAELLPCPVVEVDEKKKGAAAAGEGANGGDGDDVETSSSSKIKKARSNTGLPPVVRGSLAYCSQIPWIPPGTLRDAIVFGARFDEERYERSLDAAALRPDLEALPAHDLTEIGERGVNLSGGQRARVALARAAYAGAEVVLLDDPLSALDARVGAAVFERCIANSNPSADADSSSSSSPSIPSPPSSSPSMMSGKTRLLVTHARHYLPRCDRVAVIRNGEVAALGTPRELAEHGVPELVAAVREAAENAGGGGGGGEVDAAADAAGNEGDDDDDDREEGAGAAVAAIAAASGDLDAAGEASAWDEGPSSSSRPATPAGPLSAADGSDLGADASTAPRSPSSAAASRLRRAISKNVTGKGNDGDGDGSSSSVVAGGGGGGSTVLHRGFGSLRLAASRRPRSGAANDPALATVADAASASAPTKKDPSSPDSARLALGALVKAEGRAEGGVGGGVYASWAARLGGPSCSFVAVGLLVGQGAYLFAEYWVSILSPSSSSSSAAPPDVSSNENLRAEIAGRKVSQS